MFTTHLKNDHSSRLEYYFNNFSVESDGCDQGVHRTVWKERSLSIACKYREDCDQWSPNWRVRLQVPLELVLALENDLSNAWSITVLHFGAHLRPHQYSSITHSCHNHRMDRCSWKRCSHNREIFLLHFCACSGNRLNYFPPKSHFRPSGRPSLVAPCHLSRFPFGRHCRSHE